MGHLPQEYQDIIKVVSIVVWAFAVGCHFHMMVLGENSLKDINGLVEDEIERLKYYRGKALEQIRSIEKSAGFIKQRPNITMKVNRLKRILGALDYRLHEVTTLLASHKKKEINLAYEIIQSPLVLDTNCHEQLISGDPIEPIDSDRIVGTMRNIFKEISHEFDIAVSGTYASYQGISYTSTPVNDYAKGAIKQFEKKHGNSKPGSTTYH